MAWSQQKNDVFFKRAQNWAASLWSLLEERDRLVALYDNEASGDPDFIDHSIATKVELGVLKDVMDSVDALVHDGVVSQENRVDKLTPFLADQT